MKEIDPAKQWSDIVMCDGASNVQLAGGLLKVFFNDVSKITIVNQMISSHKMIYNVFDYGIYHKPLSKFKSKYQEFYNRKIGLFTGNETSMAGYFMGIHRDLGMR